MAKSISNEIEAPKGFEQISTADFPPKWDFEAVPICQGRVIMQKSVTIMRNHRAEDVGVMIIDTGERDATVWESASLADVFKSNHTGNDIWIQYTGPIELKGKPEPMKGFTVAVRRNDNGKEQTEK